MPQSVTKSVVKERVSTFIKLGLGGVLIYYVLRSNMVDFESLGEVVFKPINIIVSLLCLIGCAVATSIRWYYLIKAQGLTLKKWKIFQLSMIGFFFNTFMPGAVGGDLIKAWYVAGEEPRRRTKAVFTVLVDRIIGLSVIVFCSAATALIFSQWIRQNTNLKILAYSIWGFTLVSLFCLIFFFSTLHWKSRRLQNALGFLNRIALVRKLMDALLLYRSSPMAILSAIFFSSLNVIAITLLYYFCGEQLNVGVPLSAYFFVVPLGLTVSALPLLPGGIGVGQVAFFSLFSWVGSPHPEQGATACTLVQIYTILFNCLGAIFYVRFKKSSSDATLAEVTQLAEQL